ncbi:long-chain fatty acid transport protein [Geofilum rubicundum JCM 15548]|uniref:Long-chain fatty acid transport protein n=1 Tax=Geofilum rubicundum JCM 15548 TaxID=1236989 RepID=A0A0E9LU83_9BACT|nr:long-chain fatty acid transport protein [Geofilum rubicundum JCM 15548]
MGFGDMFFWLIKFKIKYMRRLISFCFMAVLAMNGWAEGYQINLQGARQIGMGHTGTGLNFGASSIHFNPGALGFLSSTTEFSAGGSAIFSNNTFQKSGSGYLHESDNPVGTPFYFYGASRINDRLVAGIGITTPFGNSLVWGDDWDGRYLIQDISLKAIFFQPTVAYQLNEWISVGAGFVLAYGDVELHKALPVQNENGDGQAELTGKTTAFGYNAGIFLQATPEFSLGLSYRSTIDMEMSEGEARFKVPASLSGQFPKTSFNAALPMPGGIQLGAGWQATEKLLIAADLQYVLWSTYEELNFDFEAESVPDSYNVRNFENTLIYRMGGSTQ